MTQILFCFPNATGSSANIIVTPHHSAIIFHNVSVVIMYVWQLLDALSLVPDPQKATCTNSMAL